MRLRTEPRRPIPVGLGDKTRVYLVQTGQTVWEVQGRADSTGGEPLTDRGRREIAGIGGDLAGERIKAVYAGCGEAETETAKLIGDRLGVKPQVRKALRELDYGLWQGLTTEEIRRRQPKVYRQWANAPDSVRPPGGETIAEAQKRLKAELRRIVKRHKGGAAVVVCRPVALGVLKCTLTDTPLEELWRNVHAGAACAGFDTDEKRI